MGENTHRAEAANAEKNADVAATENGAATKSGAAHLMQPLAVGGLTLRNRVVMVPMATGKSERDGTVSRQMCEHYSARAAWGTLGLVETEHHFVSPEGRAGARQPSASRDADVAGLARECDAVHAHDTPVLLQISHAGSAASERVIRQRAIAPSAVTCPGAKVGHPLPREMDAGDVERVVDAFAQAARRARLAGFDGVEVHAAHGYLLDQFFSPLTNRREDAYGGDLAGRLRITLEVVRAARAELAGGQVLSVRLGACDYMAGGTTREEGAAAAVALARAGADLISVSGGMCYYSRRDTLEPGWFRDASECVRRALGDRGIDVPVLLAGGVRKTRDADALLAGGSCDLVGIGRAILNNPAWPRRLAAPCP